MKKTHLNPEKQIFIHPESTLPKTYFDLIDKVGSKGKYQRMLFIIFSILYFVNGSLMLSSSFIFMNNRYACEQLGLLASECQQAICQMESKEEREQYFLKNEDNIDSAATDYGPFMCQDEYQLDIIKGIPFLGSFIGSMIFPYVSDYFGRKRIMTIAMTIGTIGALIIAMGYNITMISVGMMLSGAGINVSSSMIFYYLGQTVQNQKRQKYSILIQVGYNVAAIIMTILYYLIGSWRIIFITVTTIPVIISYFFFLFYIEETPQFLLKGQNKKALKSLNRIGHINFGLRDILSEEDLQNVKAEQIPAEQFKQAAVTPWDFFRFASLRNTIIFTILASTIISNLYYGPTLIIDSIGFNTYATSLVIQFSELIGFIPVYYYIDKIERKKAGMVLFSIMALTSFLLSVIEKPKNCTFCSEVILEIVLVFFFRFSIAVQFMIYIVYSIQLFPNRVIGLADTIQCFFGGITQTGFPLILGSLQRVGFNLMFFFCIMAIGGCFISILLDETVGKPIKTQIDEVNYGKNKTRTLIIQKNSCRSVSQ